MKLPKRIRLVERPLGRENAMGQAIAPDLVEICPRQTSRERLDTLIHEALHLLLPDAAEMTIRAYSGRLSGLLWRDRWRRVER